MLQAMQQQAPAQHGYGAQAQFDSFQSMTTPSSAPSYAPANPSHYSNNSATNFGDLVGHPSASAHAYGSSYGQPPPPMMVGYGYGSGHPASQAAPGVYGSPAPAGYPPQMGYATQPMQPYQYHSGPSTMPPSGMGYGGPHNARHPY